MYQISVIWSSKCAKKRAEGSCGKRTQHGIRKNVINVFLKTHLNRHSSEGHDEIKSHVCKDCGYAAALQHWLRGVASLA